MSFSDKHDITILYHLHQCRHCTHEIFRATVGKGGIKGFIYPKSGISHVYFIEVNN